MISRRSLFGVLGGALIARWPARAQAVDPGLGSGPWADFIEEAARRFAIPQAWIEAVMTVESGGRTHRNGTPIRSRVGAMGLMQLMPATWAEMRDLYRLGHDPDDPRDNILAGTAYLRAMFDRFGYPGLFAAYNAGPARYAASLIGQKLPVETQAYLPRVVALAGNHSTQQGVQAPDRDPLQPSNQGLFAIRRDPAAVSPRGGEVD